MRCANSKNKKPANSGLDTLLITDSSRAVSKSPTVNAVHLEEQRDSPRLEPARRNDHHTNLVRISPVEYAVSA